MIFKYAHFKAYKVLYTHTVKKKGCTDTKYNGDEPRRHDSVKEARHKELHVV